MTDGEHRRYTRPSRRRPRPRPAPEGPSISSLPPLALNAWLRWDHIRRVLAAHPEGALLLEVGAGQGGVGARLATRFRYLGVEADATAAAIAAARIERVGSGRVVNGDVADVTLENADVLCAFEVLEHIEDDHGALRAWSRHLRPGGTLVLSVPAGPHRMGPWDERVGHYRRYSRESITQTLEACGFEDVDVRTYGVPLGYALEAARNVLARRTSAVDADSDASMDDRTAASGRALQPSGAIAGALTRAATAPFRWFQRLFQRSDLGTGIVVTARRPG